MLFRSPVVNNLSVRVAVKSAAMRDPSYLSLLSNTSITKNFKYKGLHLVDLE